MKRVLVLGLPRTGTTWLARILSASDSIRYVHEPDNIEQGLLPWVPFDGLGPFPSLEPGDPAPDFGTLWRLAFAGGWPDRLVVHTLRRAVRSTVLPPRARIRLSIASARLVESIASAPPIVVAKSVRSYLAAEWIDREFEPRMLIVWRHPLNVVPSWGSVNGTERGFPRRLWPRSRWCAAASKGPPLGRRPTTSGRPAGRGPSALRWFSSSKRLRGTRRGPLSITSSNASIP